MLILQLPAAEAGRGLGPLLTVPQRGVGCPWGSGDAKERPGILRTPSPRVRPEQSHGECCAGHRARAGTRGRTQSPAVVFLPVPGLFCQSPSSGGAGQWSQPHGAEAGGGGNGGQGLFWFFSRRGSQMTQVPKRAGRGGCGGCVSRREAARCAPAVLQQLQGCCPELMLPQHSPALMPHRPAHRGLLHSECTPLGWHRQAPCPTSVLLVSLQYP